MVLETLDGSSVHKINSVWVIILRCESRKLQEVERGLATFIKYRTKDMMFCMKSAYLKLMEISAVM
jgi:hypothetical protein